MFVHLLQERKGFDPRLCHIIHSFLYMKQHGHEMLFGSLLVRIVLKSYISPELIIA